MCCRYWMEESAELGSIVEAMNRSSLMREWGGEARTKPYGETRPADVAPVIAVNRRGSRSVFPMKWGYTGRTLLINARTETAPVKPTFRDDWRSHRCVIPASWYFEWQHFADGDGRKRTGEKYMIQSPDSTISWLCGLYRMERNLPRFTVLTREPGDELRQIHDRMPLIIPEELVNEWIRPETKPEELTPYALTEMVFRKAPDTTG